LFLIEFIPQKYEERLIEFPLLVEVIITPCLYNYIKYIEYRGEI